MTMDKKVRRKSSVDFGSMIFGKVPPQAKELEEHILGAMMLEPKCILDVKNILRPEHFYVEAHQRICKAIFELESVGGVDLTLVYTKLRETGDLEFIGGPYYVSKLTNAVVSSANVIEHCYVVKQTSICRTLIGLSGEIINRAYEDENNFKDLLDFAEEKFWEVNVDIQSSMAISKEQIAINVQKQLFDMPATSDHYVYTGMKDWDKINGPLQAQLYVLAARPAMGKTAFIIEMICDMAQKYPIGFINGEMTDEQIAKRIVSNTMEFDNDLFKKEADKRTEAEIETINKGLDFFTKLKLHIDSSDIEIDKIISKIKFWVQKFGIRAVFIDFLQIIGVSEEKESRYTQVQKLDHILEKLRQAAKRLNIPIILLSQLNRENVKRTGNKEPNMSDLKGSGKIEEVSFQIAFLHRPEYYDIFEDELGETTKGLAYLLVLKHRDGKLERIKYKFEGQFSKFSEWDGNMWNPIVDQVPFTVQMGSKMSLDKNNDDDLPF